jgi:hypothetical protein
MLGRTVDGVEPQRRAPRVANIVARSRGNDDREIVLDAVGYSVDVDHAVALLDPEELVTILVNLLADLIPGLKRHRDELEVVPGVEDSSKILVLDRDLLDIVAIAFHRVLLAALEGASVSLPIIAGEGRFVPLVGQALRLPAS